MYTTPLDLDLSAGHCTEIDKSINFSLNVCVGGRSTGQDIGGVEQRRGGVIAGRSEFASN